MALLLAGIGLEVLARGGVFAPRVERVDYGWDGYFVAADGIAVPAVNPGGSSDVATTTVLLTNTGWTEERIRSVAVTGDGLEFLGNPVRATGGGPLTDAVVLAPGVVEGFHIEFRITDCRAVGDPPIVVMMESWRGVRTVELAMTRVRHNVTGWSVTTADDPLGVSGFRYLARQALRRPVVLTPASPTQRGCRSIPTYCFAVRLITRASIAVVDVIRDRERWAKATVTGSGGLALHRIRG